MLTSEIGYAPEKIPYGISRYLNETRRLYRVMETQLKKAPFLVGDKFTIADISCWGWVASAGKSTLLIARYHYTEFCRDRG